MGKQESQGQERVYRLPGVQDENGNPGELWFTIKPGGNAHAAFQPDQPAGDEPTAGQLPAQQEQSP